MSASCESKVNIFGHWNEWLDRVMESFSGSYENQETFSLVYLDYLKVVGTKEEMRQLSQM